MTQGGKLQASMVEEGQEQLVMQNEGRVIPSRESINIPQTHRRCLTTLPTKEANMTTVVLLTGYQRLEECHAGQMQRTCLSHPLPTRLRAQSGRKDENSGKY